MTPSVNSPESRFSNRTWILLGLITVLAVFGGGGAWAALTRISGAVIAPGAVSVETNIKTVQHLEGGIVAQIHVTNGDRVKAGDVLLRLDDSALQANLNILNNTLLELLARQARLQAELEGRDTIEFPAEFLENPDTELVERLKNSKAALFETRRQARLGQIRVMEEKILQFREQILGLQAQMRSQEEQAEIVRQSIERKQDAREAGVVSQDTMDQLRRQHLQLVGKVGELRSTIAEIGSTITQVELQIIQIDVDLRETAQGELRDVLSRIAELREQRNALLEQEKRTLILAPVAGRVHNMAIFTVGGVVPPGSPILQIIPENDRLIIEARVMVTDIDQITPGQEASVILSAFDSRTTPTLAARVTSVSAAPLSDSQTNTPYFSVRLEIPENELARLTPEQVLLPGMPADVYIRTVERTPLDYLLKPLASQILRAFKEQ